MDKLPRLNKKIVNVTSLDDIEEEKRYWISKTPIERIEAIEINRRMIYGQDRVTSRLQRFFDWNIYLNMCLLRLQLKGKSAYYSKQ